MQRKIQQDAPLFSATDVSDYEYCSLAWWHDHFEPLALAETDDLVAHLVALEEEFENQAPLQPDYRVIEQLLKRRGAFQYEQEPHHAYSNSLAASTTSKSSLITEEARTRHTRRLFFTALLLLLLAIALIATAFLYKAGPPAIHSLFLPTGLALLLIALALLLLLLNESLAQRQRIIQEHHHALDLPDGILVYEDSDGQAEYLFSRQFPLIGKPDYIIQLPDGRPLPIELRLGVEEAKAPYSHHVIQIAAYCLILEDYFEEAPTHGLLRYAHQDFTIEYTPSLRKKVIKLLDDMGYMNEHEQPILTKQRVSKCRACAFQPICPVGHDK
jgi:CRISPR-associated exonuclease Cas4